MISKYEIIFRLILSLLVGGFIGFEREVNNRPAGLRTHILVSIGSTLIMLISIYGFDDGDPSRLAAQVVSGIGFIGAGTILRTSNHVRGLTTAASLWVCAGIGLAIGAGLYFAAIVTAALALISLTASHKFQEGIPMKRLYKKLVIEAIDRPGLLGDIGSLLGRQYILIKEVIIYDDHNEDHNKLISIDMSIKIPKDIRITMVLQAIYDIENVINVIYEGKTIAR